jgi:predicted CopG family antitoxin
MKEMHKRMTISIHEDVHEALLRVIGRGKISQFLEGLAKPYVLKDDLLSAYQEMASDTQREKEALEWSNALIGDVDHAAW